jgi:uncharacterized protein (TIGR02001 family)
MTHGGNPIRPRLHADTGRRHPVGGLLQDLANRIFIVAILAGCLFVPLRARAGELNGEVSLASQLVDRGLAITPATPALQGGVAWATRSGWSLGVSGGVELRSPGHLAEGVARVAHTWPLAGNWRMQADLVYYHYAGRLRANVYEPGIYWLYRDSLTFGLSGVYLIGEEEHKLHPAADLGFHWPLAGGFSISGGLGVARYAVHDGHYSHGHYRSGYYRYGQLGLLWSHGAWQVELDRIAVDPGARRYLGNLVAESWLATISRSF